MSVFVCQQPFSSYKTKAVEKTDDFCFSQLILLIIFDIFVEKHVRKHEISFMSNADRKIPSSETWFPASFEFLYITNIYS